MVQPSLSVELRRERVTLVSLVSFVAVAAIGCCLYVYLGHVIKLHPIRADSFGYYAYLPSIFFQHNLSFEAARQFCHCGSLLTSAYGIGVNSTTEHMLDKYPVGSAILQTPAFIFAWTIARNTTGQVSAYSTLFQSIITANGIIFLCIGTAFTYLCARRFVDKFTALLATILIVFATNVFNYGSYDNSLSQIYSFAAIAVFLYCCLRLHDNPDTASGRFVFVTGVLLGIIFCIRNPDIIVGLIAVALLVRKGSKRVRRNLSILGAGTLVGALPQLAYVTWATGSPLTNPYGGANGGLHEGFTHLFDPRIGDFLFGVDRGIFLLAPITLIACLGFWPLIRSDRRFGLAMLGVLALDVYLCSSWWEWWFGWSFMSRPMVDMMALLVIPLSLVIVSIRARFSEHAEAALAGIMWVSAVSIVSTTILMAYYWRFL